MDKDEFNDEQSSTYESLTKEHTELISEKMHQLEHIKTSLITNKRQMHLRQHLRDSVRMRISTEINRNCFYLHLQLSLPLMPHACLMKRSFITTMFTHTFSVSLMMMENLH